MQDDEMQDGAKQEDATGTTWLRGHEKGSERHAGAHVERVTPEPVTPELVASVPQGNRPERGPDSREQREARRRRALALREEGWRRKEIAAELGVSRSTVSNWFRQEYLREREEGMRQDNLLQTATDDTERQMPVSFHDEDGAADDVRLPRVDVRSEPRSERRSRADAERVERASVTANR